MAKKTEERKVIINITDKGLKEVTAGLQKIAALADKIEKTSIAPKAGKGVGAIEKATTGMKGYQQSVSDVDRANKSLANTHGKGAKDFAKQAQGLGGLVHIYAGVAANIWAISAAFEQLKSTADVSAISDAQEILSASTGRSLAVMTEAFHAGADGALSMADAMKQASQAASAGFDSNFASQLAIVAKGASKAFGRDLTDSMDRLTRGIAKMEPEILDELGLFVKIGPAAQKYAEQHDKAAASLTEFERRQAFANEALDQGIRKFGAIADAVPTNPFSQLAANMADLKQTLIGGAGELLNSTGLIQTFTTSTAALGTVVAVLGLKIGKMLVPELGRSISAWGGASTSIQEHELALSKHVGLTQKWSREMNHADNVMVDANVTIAEGADELGLMSGAMKEAWDNETYGDDIKKTDSQIKNLKGQFTKVAKQIEQGNIPTMKKFLKAGITDSKSLTAAMDRLGLELVDGQVKFKAAVQRTSIELKEQQVLLAKHKKLAAASARGFGWKQAWTSANKYSSGLALLNKQLVGHSFWTKKAAVFNYRLAVSLRIVGKAARFAAKGLNLIAIALAAFAAGFGVFEQAAKANDQLEGFTRTIDSLKRAVKGALKYIPWLGDTLANLVPETAGMQDLMDTTGRLGKDAKNLAKGYETLREQADAGFVSLGKESEFQANAITTLTDGVTGAVKAIEKIPKWKLVDKDEIPEITKNLDLMIKELTATATAVGNTDSLAVLKGLDLSNPKAVLETLKGLGKELKIQKDDAGNIAAGFNVQEEAITSLNSALAKARMAFKKVSGENNLIESLRDSSLNTEDIIAAPEFEGEALSQAMRDSAIEGLKLAGQAILHSNIDDLFLRTLIPAGADLEDFKKVLADPGALGVLTDTVNLMNQITTAVRDRIAAGDASVINSGKATQALLKIATFERTSLAVKKESLVTQKALGLLNPEYLSFLDSSIKREQQISAAKKTQQTALLASAALQRKISDAPPPGENKLTAAAIENLEIQRKMQDKIAESAGASHTALSKSTNEFKKQLVLNTKLAAEAKASAGALKLAIKIEKDRTSLGQRELTIATKRAKLFGTKGVKILQAELDITQQSVDAEVASLKFKEADKILLAEQAELVDSLAASREALNKLEATDTVGIEAANLAIKTLDTELTLAKDKTEVLGAQHAAQVVFNASLAEFLELEAEIVKISAPFEELGAALENLDDSPFKKLIEGANDFAKASLVGAEITRESFKDDKSFHKAKLGNYAEQVGAIGNMFEEGSTAAKAFSNIEQTIHAIRMAMMVTEMIGAQTKAVSDTAAEGLSLPAKIAGASAALVSSLGPVGIGIAAAFAAAMFSMSGTGGGAGGASSSATKAQDKHDTQMDRFGAGFNENGTTGEFLETNALSGSILDLVDADVQLFTVITSLQESIKNLDSSFSSTGNKIFKGLGRLTEAGIAETFGVGEFGTKSGREIGETGKHSAHSETTTELDFVGINLDAAFEKIQRDASAGAFKARDVIAADFSSAYTFLLGSVSRHHKEDLTDFLAINETELLDNLGDSLSTPLSELLEEVFFDTIDTTFALLAGLDPAAHLSDAASPAWTDALSTAAVNWTDDFVEDAQAASTALQGQVDHINFDSLTLGGEFTTAGAARASGTVPTGDDVIDLTGSDSGDVVDRVTAKFNEWSNDMLDAMVKELFPPGFIGELAKTGEELGDTMARIVEETGVIARAFIDMGGSFINADFGNMVGRESSLRFQDGLLSGFSDAESLAGIADAFVEAIIPEPEVLANKIEDRTGTIGRGLDEFIANLPEDADELRVLANSIKTNLSTMTGPELITGIRALHASLKDTASNLDLNIEGNQHLATTYGELTGTLFKTGAVAGDLNELLDELGDGLGGLEKETWDLIKTLDILLEGDSFGGLSDSLRASLIDAFGGEQDFAEAGQAFINAFFDSGAIENANFQVAQANVTKAVQDVLNAATETGMGGTLVPALQEVFQEFSEGETTALGFKDALGDLLANRGGLNAVLDILEDLGPEGTALAASLIELGIPFENLMDVLPDVSSELQTLSRELTILTGFDFSGLGDASSALFQAMNQTAADFGFSILDLASVAAPVGSEGQGVFDATVEFGKDSLKLINASIAASTTTTVAGREFLADVSSYLNSAQTAMTTSGSVGDVGTAFRSNFVQEAKQAQEDGDISEADYSAILAAGLNFMQLSEAALTERNRVIQIDIDANNELISGKKEQIAANDLAIGGLNDQKSALEATKSALEEFVGQLQGVADTLKGIQSTLVSSNYGDLAGSLLSIFESNASAKKEIEAVTDYLNGLDTLTSAQANWLANSNNLYSAIDASFQDLAAIEINTALQELADTMIDFRDSLAETSGSLSDSFFGLVAGFNDTLTSSGIGGAFAQSVEDPAQRAFTKAMEDLAKAQLAAGVSSTGAGLSSIGDIQNLDGSEAIFEVLRDLQDATATAFEAEIALRESVIEETGGLLLRFMEVISEIQATVDGLLLGELSPLSKTQQLEISRDSFDTIVAALANPTTSDEERVKLLEQISGAGTDYLTLSKDYYAGAGNYVSEFERVRGILEALIDEATVGPNSTEDQILAILQDSFDSAQASYIAAQATLEAIDTALDVTLSSDMEAVSDILALLSTLTDDAAFFEGVENKIGMFETAVTGVNEQLVAAFTSGGSMNSTLATVTEAIALTNTAIDSTEGQISALVIQITSVASQIQALTSSNAVIASEIAALVASNKALAARQNAPLEGTDVGAGGNTTPVPSATEVAIEGLYREILGRNADVGGLDYWVEQMETGAKTFEQIMLDIQGSPEFRITGGDFANNASMLTGEQGLAATAPGVSATSTPGSAGPLSSATVAAGAAAQAGVQVTAIDTQDVGLKGNAKTAENLYHTVLGRHGDVGGLNYWAGRIKDGMSSADITSSMLAQEEMASTGPLATFAEGGIANTASIFGEAGPEAAVPLPDGRRIPVDFGTSGFDDTNIVAELQRLGDKIAEQAEVNLQAQATIAQLLDDGNSLSTEQVGQTKKAARKQGEVEV